MSGVAQGVGGYYAGKQQESLYHYNMREQRAAAAGTEQEGAVAATDMETQYKQVKGSQVAAMGASGTDISSGSNLKVLSDTAGISKLDVLRTLNRARKEAYALRQGAQVSHFMGRMAERQGRAAAIGGMISGVNQGASMAMSYGTRGGGGGGL
jgi:hypothetical protein